MKVGIYIDAYSPAVGGGYTFVVELLAALDRLRANCGHELVLCYRNSAAAIADRFPDFPTIDLDARKLDVLSPAERLIDILPARFERLRDRIRPPATHWFDRVNAKEGIQFVIRLAPWNAGGVDTPFAFVSFDLQHRISPWFPEVSASREWERRDNNQSLMFRRAHTVFTGTQQGRDEIERYFQILPERIKVLPFPVPEFARNAAAEPKNPETLRRLQVPQEYLFFPAQFWAHKNHVALLEACKIIREKANWNIGVVFSGSDKGNLKYLKEYARKLGIEKSVLFLGFVEQADLVQLYKGAFCLAYPTFFGPDNLPPVEAFALGCPVVASAVPGASEQLGDAALLFPPEDDSALADAILKLRDPDLRARMIEAGASRVRQWTWDDYARGVIESVDQFARVRRTWP
jgi:glycosyltransferase involved in cell wall biosynthesis